MDTMMDERAQTRTVANTTATLERVLNQIGQVARAEAVFGQPIERGEYTVIPCAKVSLGLGLGGGAGTSTKGAEGKAQPQGEGAGGGGGANGKPMAVIVVSRTGVRVQPIVDATRIAVTTMLAGAAIAFGLVQLRASRRRAQAFRALAFGRMKQLGRGGAAVLFPLPLVKFPSKFPSALRARRFARR